MNPGDGVEGQWPRVAQSLMRSVSGVGPVGDVHSGDRADNRAAAVLFAGMNSRAQATRDAQASFWTEPGRCEVGEAKIFVEHRRLAYPALCPLLVGVEAHQARA